MKIESVLSTAAAVLLAMGLAASAAHAAPASVYKWVDEKGIVNYTPTPPPAQRKAAVVNVAPAVTGRSALYGDSGAYDLYLRDAAGQAELERLTGQSERARQAQSREALTSARNQTAHEQALDRCRSARHVDCASNPYPAGSAFELISLYPYRQVVRRAPAVTRPATP